MTFAEMMKSAKLFIPLTIVRGINKATLVRLCSDAPFLDKTNIGYTFHIINTVYGNKKRLPKKELIIGINNVQLPVNINKVFILHKLMTVINNI